MAPHPVKDLQFLSDAAQLVVNQTIEENSFLAASQTYGTIYHPHARKRERRAGASAPVPPAKTQPKAPVKQETKPTVKEEPKSAAAAAWALTKDTKDSKPAANTTAKKMAANSAPALKRQGSSGGISQMFAKQASKPKKPAAAPKREEVPIPALSDEGEDDSEAMPEPAIQKTEEDGKSRRDRQAALRRMMDESDGEEEEAGSKSRPESPAEDPMEEDTAPPEPEAKAAEEEPAEVVASTGDGRRRGRRRVTKKKQIMDDQGYLGKCWLRHCDSFHYRKMASVFLHLLTMSLQLPYKSRAGSPSPRRRRRRPSHRRRSRRPPRKRHRLLRARRRRQKARGISCRSLARNERLGQPWIEESLGMLVTIACHR